MKNGYSIVLPYAVDDGLLVDAAGLPKFGIFSGRPWKFWHRPIGRTGFIG